MDAGMALRALSANNFLSRFLFLAVVVGVGGGGDFFVEDERGVLDKEFVAVDCLELLRDLLVLGLDLDLLTRVLPSLIIAPVIFCDSLCLDLLRDRPPDVDPDDDSIRRTFLLVVVLRFDCLLDIISLARVDLTLLLLDLV